MFRDIFVKIFKFLRILYSLYKILAAKLILWNLDKSFLEKMEISESFFGKNHEKLAHLRNLAPKTIYGFVDIRRS